jgi:hypothetical protein
VLDPIPTAHLMESDVEVLTNSVRGKMLESLIDMDRKSKWLRGFRWNDYWVTEEMIKGLQKKWLRGYLNRKKMWIHRYSSNYVYRYIRVLYASN